MPNYDSTSRTPFAKGGRAELFSGGTGKKRKFDYFYTGPPRKGDKKKKKKKKKEHEPYTKSKQVSLETMREAVQDFKKTKGKVHTTKKGRADTDKRLVDIYKKQHGYFWPEKRLKKGWPTRDKGWGGKHSQKKPEQN